MPNTPVKFKMGDKPSPSQKDKNGFSISMWAVGFFLLSIGVIAFSTVRGFYVYQEWNSNWDVITFAKQNPEIVRVVKDKYEDGVQRVKEDIVSPK